MKVQFKLKEHLFNLEEQLLKPEVRTSIDELHRLLYKDFTEIDCNGRVYSKQECMDGIPITNMQLFDFDIKTLSKDVVLTTYKIYDQTKNQESLESSIWKYRDGKWKIFFHQGTSIKE